MYDTTLLITLSRLCILWPIMVAIGLTTLAVSSIAFISINVFIFGVLPCICAWLFLRYYYGPAWLTHVMHWIGVQMASVSPAHDLDPLPAGQQAIYSCHPHGLIAAAPYIHYTLVRGVPTMTTQFVVNFPIIRNIRSALSVIDSNKSAVDAHLADGKSLTVILGGAREALATESNKMRLCADRRGIFELAVKHRVPIVPVLTYGENEMFAVKVNWKGILGRFQLWFYENFHGVWAFPNIVEIYKWLRGDITLSTHTAPPLWPTEGEDWMDLRRRYIVALETLYDETRPANYASTIEWISASAPISAAGAVAASNT
jgi:hypothetical protein